MLGTCLEHLSKKNIEVIMTWDPFSTIQKTLYDAYQTTVSTVVPCEAKEITLHRHPLQDLYYLVEKAVRTQQQPAHLRAALNAVPTEMRNHGIFREVYFLATDPTKGGDRWGEDHALDDLPRLQQAVKNVVEKTLKTLPQEKQNLLFGTIYQIAGQPQVGDPRWGEHNATADTKRLIRALHREHHLGIPGTKITFLNLETNATTPSHAFHLQRRELPYGQIGLHNGIQTTLERARSNALCISDNAAQGYNLHCTYGATIGILGDLSSAFLSHRESITPPVLQLLEQWRDFFETHDEGRLLQLCHSRGTIEVNNALNYLSEDQKKRLLVITIAPVCFITGAQAHKVLNLFIALDPVVQTATNRHILGTANAVELSLHTNALDPHNIQGSSYIDKLKELIGLYIATNDLP
jgi:hypothetical protein